jgi:hypothetical protein
MLLDRCRERADIFAMPIEMTRYPRVKRHAIETLAKATHPRFFDASTRANAEEETTRVEGQGL